MPQTILASVETPPPLGQCPNKPGDNFKGASLGAVYCYSSSFLYTYNLQEIRFESYHGACFWCSFNAFIFRIVVLQRPEIKTSSSQHNLTVIKVMMMIIKMVMIMKINMIIDHDDHH